jgi:uncharacterized protein
MHAFLTALALILVIEGGLYALFPVGMKRAMAMLLTQSSEHLRTAGFGAATAGVALIWLLDALSR